MFAHIKKSIQKYFPNSSRKIYYKINSIRYSGSKYFCPICEKGFNRFLKGPDTTRENSRCPGCSSLERQRLLWLYLVKEVKIKDKNITLLNIAPDYALQSKLKTLNNINYTSIDLDSSLAMHKADITNLNFSDNSFNAIICYHVLEHVEDDRKALSEMFRILKSDGWAILQSPIDLNRDITFENSAIKLPEERRKAFGQKDHVRIYGKDYNKRLENAGFIVIEDNFIDNFSPQEKEKYLLDDAEVIYFCRKP
jgi:SAM-dependent methyltransferase